MAMDAWLTTNHVPSAISHELLAFRAPLGRPGAGGRVRQDGNRGACSEPAVIVWLASYPRSGNTFLRVVLHNLYGVPTYSVYEDDDPVAERVGPALVGYRPKPGEQ
jgi:hypothetical protein